MTVSVRDLATTFGEAPALSFSFDDTEGANGDVPYLAIQMRRARSAGYEPFLLVT